MPCGHRFHGGCLEKWLRAHGTCPMCRHQMPTTTAPPPPAAEQEDYLDGDEEEDAGDDDEVEAGVGPLPLELRVVVAHSSGGYGGVAAHATREPVLPDHLVDAPDLDLVGPNLVVLLGTIAIATAASHRCNRGSGLSRWRDAHISPETRRIWTLGGQIRPSASPPSQPLLARERMEVAVGARHGGASWFGADASRVASDMEKRGKEEGGKEERGRKREGGRRCRHCWPPPQAAALPPAARAAIVEAPRDDVDDWQEQDNCAICLDRDDAAAAEWKETPCRHRFHGGCLDKWLEAAYATCPMCRRHVTPPPIADEDDDDDSESDDDDDDDDPVLLFSPRGHLRRRLPEDDDDPRREHARRRFA
ncbi:hypothetical protein OsI_11820 [Oryza sativa Indica Group]|uniref:RING-type domain-containing protein n=1 Tax=Oryza sativa subsp. indica TaxID=39946 RepID=B8AQJ5_ORYSI|nr:hypothetical protein OsI_11820 [Oryza sativa Indica Group]